MDICLRQHKHISQYDCPENYELVHMLMQSQGCPVRIEDYMYEIFFQRFVNTKNFEIL